MAVVSYGEIFMHNRELLEHILEFADGRTLLACYSVCSDFAAAIDYLSMKKRIWKNRFLLEVNKYPYDVIGKVYPHALAFRAKKNWGIIYELYMYNYTKLFKTRPLGFCNVKMAKDYARIVDIHGHGEVIIVMTKYCKDFSKYCRLYGLNLDLTIIHKTSTFTSETVYVTNLENTYLCRPNTLPLPCNSCNLNVVLLRHDTRHCGYPRFTTGNKFVKVEYENGDLVWLNRNRGITSKEDCFCVGRDSTHQEVRDLDKRCLKITFKLNMLCLMINDDKREFDTFREINATVTTAFHYSSLLMLGTDTGMLYIYNLAHPSDFGMLDLRNPLFKYSICSCPLYNINCMEFPTKFIILCSSEKHLYKFYFEREIVTNS